MDSKLQTRVINTALCIVLTLVLAISGPFPAAAQSPHSGFTSTTDKCGGCHRLHNSKTGTLLAIESISEFCYSCHAKGQGADTAVREGAFYGAAEGNLLGGGFQYTGQTNPVTGSHHLDVPETAFGGGGAIFSLTCLSCHTPHESPNYRLLRQQPGGTKTSISVPWNGPWTDETQTAQGGAYPAYEERNFGAASIVSVYTKNYKSGIAAWCSACHTRYFATWTPGDPGTSGVYKADDVYNAGDGMGDVSRHRHTINMTITGRVAINGVEYNLESSLPLEDVTGNGRTSDDLLTCLTCHKSHGSSAQMTGASILEPRGSLPSGNNGMNLREIQKADGASVGSRAICGECHNTAHFANKPDECAACHRAHTATAENLLKDMTVSAMCETCHTGGAGAATDVMNGKYIAPAGSGRAWGDPNMGLLGGGFNSIQNTSSVTSKHKLGVRAIPSGADPNTGADAYITLNCMSCHDPHPGRFKTAQYRLLRLRPNGVTTDRPVTWNGPWTDNTQSTRSTSDNAYRAYTDKDFDSERPETQGYTNNYKSGQDMWCAACHTRYVIREDTTPYNAGDVFGNVERHRHNTDSMISGVLNPVNGLQYDLTTDLPLNRPTANREQDTMSCITCHRAHGTDAVMSAQAAMDISERGTLPLGSTLLRRSQRGICTDCHANI